MKSAARQKNPKAFEDDETVTQWQSAYALIAEQYPTNVKIPYTDTMAEHFLSRGDSSTPSAGC
jgi:hypothetical protein